MALTSADLARLGPQAQKQVLDKLVGEQKSKKSKYGNRKVVRDGIKFDSEREAARFGELKVLRAMGYDGAQLRFRWNAVDVLSVRELSESVF